MARYEDDAKFLANLIKDKNRLKAQIAGAADVTQIGKRTQESFGVEVWNVGARTRDTSEVSIWGAGEWNTGTWNTNAGFPSYSEVVKRRWEWNSQATLDLGTYDQNITVVNGDIRFNI